MGTEVQNNIGMDAEKAKALVGSYEMSEGTAQSIVDKYKVKEDPDGFDYALDIMQGVVKGPANAIKEAAKTLGGKDASTPWMDWILENTGKLDTTAGEVTEGFSRFLSSYGLLRGYGAATTTAKGAIGVATAKGAIVDFTIWSEEDGRLSNVLHEHGMENVITEYLKSDPNDSMYEDKFKHALEGGLLGIVSEGVIRSLVASYKGAKAKLWSKGKLPEEVAIEVDTLLGRDQIIPTASKNTSIEVETILKKKEEVPTTQKKEVETDKVEVEVKTTFDTSKSTGEFPKELGFPKPRYRAKEIVFANDLEKAIYMIGSKTKSARYDEFLAWAKNETGATTSELLTLAKTARENLKKAYDSEEPLTLGLSLPKKETVKEATDFVFKEKDLQAWGTKPPHMSFNYERMGLEADDIADAQYILENIAKSEDFMKFAKTGVKPQEVTLKQAKLLEKKITGSKLTGFAKQTMKETKDLDVKLTFLRQQMLNRYASIQKRISSKDYTNRVELLNSIKELQELYVLTLGTKSLQTGTARATAAGRIDLIPREMMEKLDEIQKIAPAALETEAKKIIDDVTAKRIHKQLKKLTDIEDSVTLHRVMKDLTKSDKKGMKLINILTELRLTSLLSGPVTLMKNIAGNYTVRKAANLEYKMAGVIGKWRSRKNPGVERFMDDEIEALTNGSRHQAFETLNGFMRAIKQIPKGSAIKFQKALKEAEEIGEKHGVDSTQYKEALAHAKTFKPYEDVLEESYLDFYQKYDTGSYRAISSNYLMDNVDTPLRNSIGHTVDAFGALVRVPYQSLGITDDMFKRVIYGSEIKGIATREANILKLPKGEKEAFIDGFYKAHEALFLKKGGKELTKEQKQLIETYIAPNKGKFHVEAIERAREGTFQEELRTNSRLNTTLKSIDTAIKSFPTGQWMVPFYRTPVNIIKWVGRRTPGIHKLSSRMRDDIAAGGRRKALAESRLVMGSSLYAIAGTLAYNNMITGTAPPGERKIWEAAGIQENSIKNPITGEWIPFNGLDPMGMFLGLTAEINMFMTDLYRQGKLTDGGKDLDKDLAELTGAMVIAFGNQVTSKSWMKSFDEAVMWTKGQNPTYAEKMAATFLPWGSFANFIQNGEGDELKEAIGLFEAIKKKYAPDGLRARLDIFGKPQTLTSFLGMRTRVQSESPIRLELMRLKTDIPKMDRFITYKGTKLELEPEAHHKLQRLVATHFNFEERLNKLIASTRYKKAVDGVDWDRPFTKKGLIKSLFTKSRTAARKVFLKENKELLDELYTKHMDNIATLKNQKETLYEGWIKR